MKRFIIRNWSCDCRGWKAQARENGSVQFQSEGLRNRSANGVCSSLSPSPKTGEDQRLSSKTARQRERILLYSAFYSTQAFNRLEASSVIKFSWWEVGSLCLSRNWSISAKLSSCGPRVIALFLYGPFHVHRSAGRTSPIFLILVNCSLSLPLLPNATIYWPFPKKLNVDFIYYFLVFNFINFYSNFYCLLFFTCLGITMLFFL